MNFSDYLIFGGKNLLFSSVALIICLMVGWFLYNNLVLRKISLHDALFGKDNMAAWIEFMGAFILPVLYVVSVSLKGSAHSDYFMDLGISSAYALVAVILMTILRLFTGAFINMLGEKDEQGKITLTNEIYSQHNTAAAMFSVAFSTVFANIVAVFDFNPDFIISSLLKIGVILILTLIAITIYSFSIGNKTSLFKQLFTKNNAAAGIGFMGFVLAIQYILSTAINSQVEFDFLELSILSIICLVVFAVVAVVLKWIFTKIVKADMWSEIYEQNNIGAAIGQAVVYLGTAIVIMSYIG